ncbi:MAG: AAA family ATPase, partial [Planctomycetota bacterium]
AAIAEQISNAESSEASLQAEAHDAKLLISRHDQHVEILSEQLTQLKRDTSERGSADREAASEVATLVERTRLCELSLLSGRGQISTLQFEVQELATHQKQMAARRRSGASQRQELARRLHEARRAAESTRSQLQQAELDAERLRLERTALADRMQEDYGIDLAEAAREAPAAEPEDRASLEQELSLLRGQVGSVSAVNLDSLEELDQLEERFAQLSSQYNDLSEAKTSLERLSTRISTESRQLFLATVDEVRGHFRELFRRLFGGGEADIIMLEEAEGADPLDAGVEIAVSPPGKELRSISLMSGGEKTLTCVALLLAVFRTKPSPFCVLDEVDAALDESNVGRFTGVLSEFLSSTQFIVVTHSKKTMTGADTLYGVTMQESGISKQVSVRFEDVGEDGQISPAATLRRQTPPSQAA